MTFPTLAPLEFSELGAPRATKTMDLGRDRMTVDMYSQNDIPVQAKRGLAKSVNMVSVSSYSPRHMENLTRRDNAVSNDQHASKASLLSDSSNCSPPDLRSNLLVNISSETILEKNTV
jgi:hypothetical protein